MPSRASREAAHQVVYTNSSADDDGMSFSFGNWRYWLLGVAGLFLMVGVILAVITAAPIEGNNTDSYKVGYTIGRVVFGLLCVAFLPALFFAGAVLSSVETTRRGLFSVSAVSAAALAFLHLGYAAISLAAFGTAGAATAREEAFKQGFATIEGYVAPYEKSLQAFIDAGGNNPKTLTGAATIDQRIAMAVKVKNTNAEALKLLENVEPTLNSWFSSAGVSSFARDGFWEDRHAREYVSALKEMCAAESRLSPAVIEYLNVMRRQSEHFGVASDGSIFFSTEEELDAYRTARGKLTPLIKNMEASIDAVQRIRAEMNAGKKKK